MNQISMETKPTSNRRGFAGMTKERRVEIARKGGTSVPAHKRAFSKDHELAAKAGKVGGTTSKSKIKATANNNC